jgi:sensor domain CHASE-containing protein
MPAAAQISLQRFSLIVALPIILAALAAAALVSCMLYWSSIRADDISFARQERLVRLVILQLRDQIAHDQESSTVWDDAIKNVREHRTEWIDANLGSWMHTYFGHDGAIVLDPANEPVFASLNGKIAPAAASYATVTAQAKPLVKRMRLAMEHWDGTSPRPRSLSPSAADLVIVNNRPAVISLKPIVSDTGEIKQTPGTEYLHIAFRYLDETFIDNLQQNYLFEGLRFSWTLDTISGEAAVPLRSSSATNIGYLIWTPYRPGTAVMSFMAPALLILFVVTAAILAFLIRSTSRALRQSQPTSGRYAVG